MASQPDAREVVPQASRRLPPRLTSFVGRDLELSSVADALARTRLVTLTGGGGCGKSRLAAEGADRLAGAYPDGLWWVDLAALTDPSLLPASVAAALEVREAAGADPVATIQERLGDRELLVVLDNCEHLVDACAALTERLLRACTGLRILATSREPLGVSGETVWRVPSLGHDDAVRLFAERAQQADAGFRLTALATADVAELCRRLDGMPLAIELAAARVRTLSPRQIIDALGDRFRLLGRAGRGDLPRHATLQASVDWSYELLDGDERRMLARVAVFPASFSLEAAQAVCGDAWGVLALLDRLVDRSLVQSQDAGDEKRYRLLETIREYAARKLDPAETAALRDAHLQVFVALAERAEPELEGPDQLAWIQRLDRELPNLRAAAEWAAASGQTEAELRLGAALWLFFVARGYLTEMALRLAGTPPSDLEPRLRARVLLAAGFYRYFTGDLPTSMQAAEEALGVARALGDAGLVGRALCVLGFAEFLSGLGSAPARFEEAIPVSQEAGNILLAALATTGLGTVQLMEGDTARARGTLRNALSLSRGSHNPWALAAALLFTGQLHCLEGAYGRAEETLTEGIEVARAVGDVVVLSMQLAYLGHALARVGRLHEATSHLDESVRIARERRLDTALAWALVHRGLLALHAGEPHTALLVLDEALHLATAATNRGFESWALALAGDAHLSLGDPAAARQRWMQAEELARRTSRTWPLAVALEGNAALAARGRDFAAAEAALYELLRVASDAELEPQVVDGLEMLGRLLAATSRAEAAARLLGAAGAHRRRLGYVGSPVLQLWTDSAGAPEPPGDEHPAAWEEGTAMSLPDAVAYALRGRGPRGRPRWGIQSLSPVERDVVRLVAAGLTNPQIAEQLFVSPRTVQTHLRRIFPRLGVRSRAELAALAARHGL